MESTLKRTWAVIDLDALKENYDKLRRHIGPGVKFLGVVKADAYGHGAIQVSRVLQRCGADYLAVSSADEAVELRRGGITMPILILGHTPKEQVENLICNNITQAVTCRAKALEYSEEAVRCGGTLKIHIKVDTGMSRLGYLVAGDHFATGVEGICESCRLPGLDAEGIFTHFAVSDEEDEESREYTREQFALFTAVIEKVEEKLGRKFRLRHCANSGAVANWPEMLLDMVRPGLLVYGCGEGARKLGLHGRGALWLCRRLFSEPVGPLQPHDGSRPRTPAGAHLHGYVHDRPDRSAGGGRGRRGGGIRSPQPRGGAGGAGGDHPL